MKDCKNYEGARCDRSCFLTGKCAEHQRRASTTDAQPQPVRNEQHSVQDMVIEDIERRKAMGLAKYGTLLQPMNGRRTLVDAYQEALDQTQYLRQAIEEENVLAAALEDLVTECEAAGRDVKAYRRIIDAYRMGNPRRV